MDSQIIRLQEKLMRKAKRLGFDVEKEDIIDEIECAIAFVNYRRDFNPTSISLYDKKFETNIIELALSAISKYGAEGEVGHSENGTARSYENGGKYPNTLVMQIPPVARGV